jgi:Fur family ferric uptake transcriptional regulator
LDTISACNENEYHFQAVMSKKTIKQLKDYVRLHNLRWTAQRHIIAKILFGSRQHFTTEELFQKAKAKDPAIGYATVSRTLHLLTDAGFCEQLDFSDGSMRFEVYDERAHHDHLVCTHCGTFIEVYSPQLEKIQTDLVKQHGFFESHHRLQIFGLCKICRKLTASSD